MILSVDPVIKHPFDVSMQREVTGEELLIVRMQGWHVSGFSTVMDYEKMVEWGDVDLPKYG